MRALLQFRPGLPFVLLWILLGALWVAGGASRADVMGQVVVRGVAWAVLITMILFGERPQIRAAMPIALLLLAALTLALLQLIPLPPAWWQALSGRTVLLSAVQGEPQPWRPLSIVPGATENAASSLIVPFAVFALLTSLHGKERRWLPGIILGLVVAATIVGLLQFSGAGFNNAFVNDTVGAVSGTFANRNHFALFVAIGCLLAPAWAFLDGRRPRWRGLTAFGLIVLFELTILASGSRAGLVLGVLGLGIGLILVRQGIMQSLSRYPRWVFPALIAAIVGMVTLFSAISIAADRAIAIDRIMAIDPGQDMRSRGLSTVLSMIGEYFPIGSGLGSFDSVFRMHEPFALLKPTYFNHAHNDWLEVVLDAGLPGAVLLGSALIWWAMASLRAWRTGAEGALARLGSAMLLLVFLASIFDYPARTPLIMAVVIVAGWWLSGSLGDDRQERSASALPRRGKHL